MKSIQIYAGDSLAYDNRLSAESGYTLLAAHTTEELNKGGCMTIILPPMHPLYERIPAMRTAIELRYNGHIRWRGRALPPTDDFYRRRKILCEGELCFFRDVVHRPHVYEGTPNEIFRRTIEVYNAAVEPWKRFAVGTVSVTDPNNYIRLERQNPETVYDTLQTLVERLGGFLIFDTSEDGRRQVNWFAKMPFACNQKIQFAENLLDYNSSADMDDFATRLIPYGAVQEDGTRLQINVDGKDYVENTEALKLRGVIEKSVIYDDITLPENLLKRAQVEVAASGLLPRQITITAVDLSTMTDEEISDFRPGQSIVCESVPHGLSGRYDLLKMDKDWLSPGSGTITLSAEGSSLRDTDKTTLTGAVASGNRENSTAIAETSTSIQGGYKGAVAAVKRDIQSSVDQTAEHIRHEITEVITKVNGVSEELQLTKSQIEMLSDEISIKFTQSMEYIENVNGDMQSRYESITKLIRATIDGILIGESGSDTQLRLDNDIIEILVSSIAEVVIDRSGLRSKQVTVQTINQGAFTWTVSGPNNNILTLS